jgi:hypothetical protein
MIKFKHKDPDIDPNNPFVNCKLKRKIYGEMLCDLVKNSEDGFVLAINNEWGTGKTTFVKMWQALLEKEGFKTLYFNAWECDYENDVFLALLSEFKKIEEIKKDKDNLYSTVIKHSVPVVKRVSVIAVKNIVDKFFGKGFTQEVLDSMTEITADSIEKELQARTQQRQDIETFKHSLHDFVAFNCNEKPLVFIVDELDRCRPDYAVNVLEQIKHLFSIPNIVFVLSIDKKQLGHAICGFYGSEHINAEEYLRRFIDIEYSLPEPHVAFYKYLIEYYDLNRFFNGNNELRDFHSFIEALFYLKRITLRQQERILSHAGLCLSSFGYDFKIPGVLVFLIYLRQFYLEFYNSLKNCTITYQDIVNETEKIIQDSQFRKTNGDILLMTAYLLILYEKSNIYNGKPDNLLFNSDGKGNLTSVNIVSNIKTNPTLEETLFTVYDNSDYYNFSLEYLTSKIDLYERFK